MKIVYLSFLISLLTYQESFSQDFIEYTFDKAIDVEIKAYVEDQLRSDSTKKFYFHLATSKSHGEDIAYVLFIGHYTDRPLDFIFDIISRSTRFYIYNGQKIPICFDYDFKLVGYGTNKRGGIIRKAYTGTQYFIEFTSSGKVIRKGA